MSKHRQWRKEVKKLRRKRIRQKLAAERDKKLKEEEERLLKDPIYQNWLIEQEKLEEIQREIEQKQHDEEEEKWLRRELLAQKQFREEQKRRQEIEKAKEEQRIRIQKEFEEQQNLIKQKQEERKRLAEEQQRKHERLLEKIREYIQEGGEMPEEFHETADTNPGKELCSFFSKTASCRFGDKCSRNHSRPGISKILLLSHFFTHIRLEQYKNTEYGNDISLECSDDELYDDYNEFFEDVIPELEKYGRIENFRACNNCEPHLRGNVYVEFKEERDSLKAFMALQGRYYAGKRINIEFASIPSWKAAVCGLSLSRRCPKGKACNFLHIFKNPLNKYNTPLNITSSRRSERSTSRRDLTGRKSENYDNFEGENIQQKRNWRWSESPDKSMKQNEHISTRRSRSRSDRIRRSRSRRKENSRSRRKEKSRSPTKNRKSRSRSPLQSSERSRKYRSSSRSRSRYSHRSDSSISRIHKSDHRSRHESYNNKKNESKDKRKKSKRNSRSRSKKSTSSRSQSNSPHGTKSYRQRKKKKKKSKKNTEICK